MGHLLDPVFTCGPYRDDITLLEHPMLRREPSTERATVSDVELGLAAILLILAVFLAAVLVPAFG